MDVYQNLNKAIAYIEENLFDEIDMRKVSAIIGTNEHSFASFFTILTGVSINNYIKLRRLSESIKLLPSYSILDLAILCGYNSRAGFSRAFKEFYGCNPSEFKENAQVRYFKRLYFGNLVKPLDILDVCYKNFNKCVLYGQSILIDKDTSIRQFWETMLERFPKIRESEERFGLVYLDNNTRKLVYYIALKEKFAPSNKELILPAAYMLSTTLNRKDEDKIKNIGMSIQSKELVDYPDIEIYRNDKVELLYKIVKK